MKNKQRGFGIIAVVIVVAIVGAAGAGTYVAVKKKAAVKTDVQANATTTAGAKLTGSAAIKDIFALGDNLRCEISVVHATGKTEGVVYTAERGARTRGDFTTETSGSGKIESHFLKQGQTGYMWTSSMKQGIKITIPEGQILPESTEATTKQGVDFGTNVSYDCDKWSPDNARFQIPADIQFTAIANVGAGLNAGGASASTSVNANASIKAQQCAACDMAPTASAKAQCRTALGC